MSYPILFSGLICGCGRRIETTGGNLPRIAQYDEHGEIIYAVCIHGVTYIDKRPEAQRCPAAR